MKHCNISLLALAFCLSSLACDKSASSDEGGAAEPSKADGAEKAAAHVDEVANKTAKEYGKEFAKNGCEILTAQMVAKTFDVPEAELKQMKMMGCIYNWKKKVDDKTETMLEARITLIMSHKTADIAKQWFAKATKNVTAEEAKAQMNAVTEKAKEHESVDTKLKEKTVGTMGGLAAESVGKEGYSYAEVSGLGDEAKIASSDGALWIRVGNLTFTVAAYKGPPQPPVDIDIKNLKAMAAKSMAAQREWTKKTFDERKEAGTKLARLVVATLD